MHQSDNPNEEQSPSLSQPQAWDAEPTGLEPTIKGVESQLVQSWFAAYRQGKVSILLRMMDTRQQNQYQKWSVGIALRCARRLLPLFEAELPGDRRPRLALEAASEWLFDQSHANTAAAVRAGRAAERAAMDVVGKIPRSRAVPLQHAALAAKCAALSCSSLKTSYLTTAVASVESVRTGMFDYKYAPDAVQRAQLRAAMIVLQKRLS